MKLEFILKKTVILLLFTLSYAATLFSQVPDVRYSVTKIWDKAPHCAFTDLIEYRGKYYCTFREGTGHIPAKDNTGNGMIRILASRNGRKWTSVALFAEKGVDLRDPKLSVTPDGRLMLLAGASIYDRGVGKGSSQYVAFADKKVKSFSALQPARIDSSISPDRNWLWRVTWGKTAGYGVLYQTSGPKWVIYLLETNDGINYRLVTGLDVAGQPNEATVELPDSNKMRIVVRREDGNTGYLGYSEYPYKSWEWRDLGIRLGGPDLITLPNGQTVLGTRSYSNGEPKTSLFTLDDRGKAVHLLEFPSGGDTSYPGMIVVGDELWVSYYSGHEGQTSVYLAKIPYRELFPE
jgi:hypothetical protein